MMQCTKPVLVYFDGAGIAESARLAFAWGSVKFIDRRVTPEEWASTYKSMSPTGRCPMLLIGDKVVVESTAILRTAARQSGLCPSNAEDLLRAQEFCDRLVCVRDGWLAAAFADPNFSPHTAIQVVIRATREVLVKSTESLEAFAKTYGQSGNFPKDRQPETCRDANVECSRDGVVGKTSFADMLLAAALRDVFRGWPEGEKVFAAERPWLHASYRRIVMDSRLRAYYRRFEPVNLTYFDIAGMAEPIRWALDLVPGLKYVDRRLTFSEWPAFKEANPLVSGLPLLQIGDTTYSESRAILEYVAARGGFEPTCAVDQANVKAAINTGYDLFAAALGARRTAPPGAEVQKLIGDAMRARAPDVLSTLEKLTRTLRDPEGHLVGGQLTAADLYITNVWRAAVECRVPVHDIAPAIVNTARLVNRAVVAPRIARLATTVASSAANPSQAQPLISLVYFAVPGVAEAARLCLHAGHVQFTDRRLTRVDWTDEEKAKSPTGQLPYIAENGVVKVVEARAILTYAAQRAGMLPTTLEGELHAEVLLGAYQKVRTLQRAARDSADPAATRARQNVEDYPAIYTVVEKLLAQQQCEAGWAVESTPTWIDFYFAAEMADAGSLIVADFAKTYPNFAKVVGAVYKVQGVIDYLKSTNQVAPWTTAS